MSTPPQWPPITMTSGLDGTITIEVAGAHHATIPPGPRARYDAVHTVAQLATLLNRDNLHATAIDTDGHIYTLLIHPDGHATDTTSSTGITGITGTDSMSGTTGSAGDSAHPRSNEDEASDTHTTSLTGMTGSTGMTSTDGNDATTGSSGSAGDASADTPVLEDPHTHPLAFTDTARVVQAPDQHDTHTSEYLHTHAHNSPDKATDATPSANTDTITGHSGVTGNADTTGLPGSNGMTGTDSMSGNAGMSGTTGEDGAHATDSARRRSTEDEANAPAHTMTLTCSNDAAGTDGMTVEGGVSGGVSTWLDWTPPVAPLEAATSPVVPSHATLVVSDKPVAGEGPGQEPAHPAAQAVADIAVTRVLSPGEVTVPPRARPAYQGDTLGEAGWEQMPSADRERVSWVIRALRTIVVVSVTLLVFCAGIATGVGLTRYISDTPSPAPTSDPSSAVVEDTTQSGADHAQSAPQSGAHASEAGDADPKANNGEDTTTPSSPPERPAPVEPTLHAPPAPAPPAPPSPTPVPAPAPEPVGVSSLATSVSSSGGGAATLTVTVQGTGLVPVTVRIGGASTTLTVNAPGTASTTLTPGPGQHSWTTSAAGVTNTGSLTVY